MLSKVVTECETSANFVHAAIETHGEAMAKGLEANLDAERQPGDGPVPDGRHLVKLVGRRMMRLLAVLLAADAAHEAELLDDAGPRKRRDNASGRVYQLTVGLRQSTAWIYGAEAEAALGFNGTTPDEPRTLVRVVKLALSQFDDAIRGRAARPGFVWQPAEAKAELAAALAELESALREVEKEQKEAEATLAAKHAALAAYHQAFLATAGLVSLLLTMAGEHELASRVRPSKRRAGRVVTEDERVLDGEPVA
jgi:hypothetical protein